MVTMARTSTCSTTEGFSRPVLNDSPRIEQIVGRERRERLSQLAWCGGGCFDSRRRVNSDVMRDRLRGSNPLKGRTMYIRRFFGSPDIQRLKSRGDTTALARALKHRKADVRSHAAKALGELRSAEVWLKVANLIDDPDD